MREDLLKEALLDLEEDRRRNEETNLRRIREIRREAPEIAGLLDRRENMIGGGVRGILAGKTLPEDLPERMEEISGLIRRELVRKGYPEDYLTPVFSCPVCRDTGLVGDRIRERCECVRKRYQKKLRRAIGLQENGRETFETFDLNVFPDEKTERSAYTQREAMKVIRETCERWADACPDQTPRDLILSGPSGLGKTFLLHAMANRLIERDVQVLLMSAYSFLEIARRSYFEGGGQLEELIGTQVLMLDDLGSEPLMQNVTIEQLFNLINERQRRNLTTVISTNLNQEELKNRYTERIASRLTDQRNCLYIPIKGRDIRRGRD